MGLTKTQSQQMIRLATDKETADQLIAFSRELALELRAPEMQVMEIIARSITRYVRLKQISEKKQKETQELSAEAPRWRKSSF